MMNRETREGSGTENRSKAIKKDAAAGWILGGIPVISIVGSVMHFVYEWSGEMNAVGLFAPVNESIWEHLKLIFWPSLIWLIIGYLSRVKKDGISASSWFSSGAAGLYAGPPFIASFYYTYTGAFGIHSLSLDILSFVLAVVIAQLLTLHIYRSGIAGGPLLIAAASAILLLASAFMLFTFWPPGIPLFRDPVTGSYGIQLS